MNKSVTGITFPLQISTTLGHSSSDIDYGPHSSIQAALSEVEYTYDEDLEELITRRGIGLTVGIYSYNGVVYSTDDEIPVGAEPDGVVEHWWKSGITDEDLVIKSELPTVSDDAKGKYLKVSDDGSLSWEEAQGGSGKLRVSSVYSPVYTESGTEYRLEDTEADTITNMYRATVGEEESVRTADVVAVKNTAVGEAGIHFMLNPDISYIIHGGGAESSKAVLLDILSPVRVKKSSGIIREIYLRDNRILSCNPSDADVKWGASPDSITEDDFEFDPSDGESADWYAQASAEGYDASRVKKVHFEVSGEDITITVELTGGLNGASGSVKMSI